MSRLLILGLTLVCSAFADVKAHASSGLITNSKRTLHMLEPDVIIYTNDISFKPDAKHAQNYFEYIVAEDYKNTLVDLTVFAVSNVDEPLHFETLDSSKLYSKSLTRFNETDFTWYRLDITEMMKESRDGQVHLQIKEYHKRRRTPFPESITLKTAQTMEFFDSQYLLSPYEVEKQVTLYMLEAHRIIMFKETESVKQVKEGIRYGPFKNTPPFSFELIRLLFEYNDPQLLLTRATKTYTVSHWGNINIDEHFELENVGAKLKGEFSRVDYDYLRKGDNCLKQISAEYPAYIQGMYFHDYVGNISSTNAFRDKEAGKVSVNYRTRFPVCGGWKVDWNQGYNMPTKYHLAFDEENQDGFILEVGFFHGYDVLLAEDYTVSVVLPYGAYDIEIDVPFDDIEIAESLTFSTLDFFGKPTIEIRKRDVYSVLHNENFKVYYRFNQRWLLLKPLLLSATIFGFYLLAIIGARLKLSFDRPEPKQKIA